MNKALLLFLLICLLPQTALARPVSYGGGTTLMLTKNELGKSAYLHYSPTWRYSIGAEVVQNERFNSTDVLLRATRLLDRKNTKGSQRNLYASVGLSEREQFMTVFGDYETHTRFVGFRYEQRWSDVNYQEYGLKAGFAPYLNSDFDGLQVWLMLDIERNTLVDEGLQLKPGFRAYKGKHLIDVKFSDKTISAHYMARF